MPINLRYAAGPPDDGAICENQKHVNSSKIKVINGVIGARFWLGSLRKIFKPPRCKYDAKQYEINNKIAMYAVE